jgi:dimethylaniline monooxygenase (N-oxide forming)
MESPPSFFQILARSLKMTLVWALGANFNAKFRLEGPWAWYGTWEVLEGEYWETIMRRGGFFGEFYYARIERFEINED